MISFLRHGVYHDMSRMSTPWHVEDYIIVMTRMIFGHVKVVTYDYMSRIISRHVTVVHTVTCHGLNNVYGKDDFWTHQGYYLSLHDTEYITTCHGCSRRDRSRIISFWLHGWFLNASRMLLIFTCHGVYHDMSRLFALWHVTDHIIMITRMIFERVKDVTYNYISRSISRHVTVVRVVTCHGLYLRCKRW